MIDAEGCSEMDSTEQAQVSSENKNVEKKSDSQTREKQQNALPEDFMQKLESLGSVEEKLELALSFMQKSLQEGGGRHFREFWDARKLCTDLFLLNIHPSMRVRLWTQYSDLCREARRLKDLFDEQSSFVSEQIEKAIEAVESELPLFHEKGTHLPEVPRFSACTSVLQHIDRYTELYHELQYLNSFASRITALRKELIKTDMRFKQRQRLLDRLSALGDKVFPQRKQAISEISALFQEDVEAFIRKTFVGELKAFALFDAREEIKRLQEIAKILTLGTEAFSKTRIQLSECWDSIRNVLKEKKKAQNEQKILFKKHRDELVQELATMKEEIEKGALSSNDAKNRFSACVRKMKEVALSRQDVQEVREKLREVEELFSQHNAQEHKGVEAKGEKESRYKELLERIKSLLEQDSSAEAKEEELLNIAREVTSGTYNRTERLSIDCEIARGRSLVEKMLNDRIQKERQDGSEESLHGAFVSLEHLRADCKQQIEIWRKVGSGSNIDFSIAMQYLDLIEEEKQRIARIEHIISEFEEES